MKNDRLELRMYGFVPYNLSPLQQGIQFGHAVVEYGLNNFKDRDYQNWVKNHKTFIVLNGSTTNNAPKGSTNDVGTMQKHLCELKKNGIKVATFCEPDLNDALTAIVFLVDERGFNKEKYPDFTLEPYSVPNSMATKKAYRNWKNTIGKKNIFLREFLKPFKLA